MFTLHKSLPKNRAAVMTHMITAWVRCLKASDQKKNEVIIMIIANAFRKTTHS